MALRGIVGITLGLAAAIGGAALAARKLFGTEDGAHYTGDTGAGPASATASTPAPPREGLDPTLLEILACPDDKEPVIYQKEGDAERLTCIRCGKRYPVRDGIPVMLIDEATPGPAPTEEEIAAARALIPEGKPAIVGATSSQESANAESAPGGTGSTRTRGSESPAASATAKRQDDGAPGNGSTSS